MTAWRWADPDVARARIGAICLRDQTADAQLGEIILRDHQRDAAGRLRHAIEQFGGALLADEVGLGKTYTALATARGSSSLLVVAPAALAPMWQLALERSRQQADFISFDTLSRRDPPPRSYEMVIVDEAHHARNPLTHRFARLAALTRTARVLLLSATPVHNATTDLRALLSIFLGSRADCLTPAELSACVVRRTRGDVRDLGIPARAAPVWCELDASPETLRAILDIPTPCPPRDGGDGGALVAVSLVRAWASCEATLRATLRRRIARADSLADALACGRHPSRGELSAWVVGDDATQLAFPELVAEAVGDDVRKLLDAVRRHAAGARRALAVLASSSGAIDDQRCAIIRDIRRRHAGERVVVFSQFADSVREVFARLRADGGVASVTAGGAWVAGGPITRTEVLNRFAPVASSSRLPTRAEAVELLIATDLLSEGLNLQDAAVVIHLDLPWTAARLTQRLGRVWRIGSPHARVHEYAIAPPAPAEQLLHVKELLTRKAGAAWSAIGEAFAPLLAGRRESVPARSLDRPRATEELRTLLHRWAELASGNAATTPSNGAHESATVDRIPVAGVRAAFDGWIALVETNDAPQVIVGRMGIEPSADPRAVLDVARAADGAACVASPSRVARVLKELDGYLDAARAAAEAGVTAVGSKARAAAASRIAALAAAAPPHRRVAVSRLAASARRAVAGSRTAGAERLLAALIRPRGASDDAADAAETWLERVIDAAGTSPNAIDDDQRTSHTRVTALVVLVPAPDAPPLARPNPHGSR
jgi:superfamily II DNA or RNA helicase